MVDLGSENVSALHFRGNEGPSDTLALWTNCGNPQCDTRRTTLLELSLSGVTVYNGFGRAAGSAFTARFNASALPLYIAFPGEDLEVLVSQLRRQFE